MYRSVQRDLTDPVASGAVTERLPASAAGGGAKRAGAGSAATRARRGARAREESRSPRILVVEDDFLVAAELEAALTDAGYEVVATVRSADEAIAVARDEKPDLAIMDIRLAGPRDGVEAARDIFGATGIRSIFATAHHDPATRARAAPAAPLGWLAKPFATAALVALVEEALRRLGKA